MNGSQVCDMVLRQVEDLDFATVNDAFAHLLTCIIAHLVAFEVQSSQSALLIRKQIFDSNVGTESQSGILGDI